MGLPHGTPVAKGVKEDFLRGLEENPDLRLKRNCAYADAYYRTLAAMACHGRTAECEGRILRDGGRETPSGDAPLYHLKRLDPATVLASFLAWNRDLVSSVDLPAVGVLAIDVTTAPYFGEDRTHVVRSKEYRIHTASSSRPCTCATAGCSSPSTPSRSTSSRGRRTSSVACSRRRCGPCGPRSS